MQKSIFRTLNVLDNKVEKTFGYRIDPFVEIRPMGYNLAGTADYLSSTICLNSNFFHYPYSRIKETVIHEYCHLFVVFQVGLSGIKRSKYYSHHGKEWKAAMRFFGQKPTRCHNLKAPLWVA